MPSMTHTIFVALFLAGVGFRTVDLNVKMVRPVPINEEFLAHGKVIDRTKTSAISPATLKDRAR